MFNLDFVQQTLDSISYKDYKFIATQHDDGDTLISIQATIPDNMTTEETMFEYCRCAKLEEGMSKSDIVHTALFLTLQHEEHEAMEKFRYKGEVIYSPHFNVDRLARMSEEPATV